MSAVTSHITLDSVFHSPTDHGLDPEIAPIVGSIARASVEVAGLLRYEPFRSGDGVEQPLGTVAHDIFLAALRSSPVRAVLSAEASEPIPLDASASFAVAITALDGSGNIATNAPTGTIFSVLRAPAHDDPASAFLHAGRRQIFVAGFVMYGAATVMALSLGQGTDLFVLDHGGTFVRTHGSVAMPTGTREFAVNAANYRHWDPRLQIYVDDLVAGADGPRGQNFDMRWTGAIVAEAYRILLSGGIFLCPSDAVDSDVNGRPRLVCAAQPIALLVEQVGGAAVDLTGAVLDRVPRTLHECCSVVFGSHDNVGRVVEYLNASQFTGERSPLFATRGLFRS